MMSSWSGWRSTMVCAGWPSSQRNRLGTVTHTLPVATSGWDSILSERVWVKSADQLCKLVCTANQRSNWTSRSSARATIAARHSAAMVQATRLVIFLFLLIIILFLLVILFLPGSLRLRLGLGLRNRRARRNCAMLPLARWE